MNKLNIYKLICFGILIFICCFGISYLAKKIFNLDSDFLSATATFFAAVVAFSLFNDWRIQYKTELFERLKERIHNLYVSIENQYDILHSKVLLNDESNSQVVDITKELLNFTSLIESLIIELEFYEKIIAKFNLDKSKIEISPADSIKILIDYKDEIICQNRADIDSDAKLMKYLKEHLQNNNIFEIFTRRKKLMSNDLQTIVLDFIEEQKGH